MTAHLGLDALTYLVDSSVGPAAGDHLSDCELCRTRLANLRIASADVSAALAGTNAPAGARLEAGPMPADVAARITAALAAERGAQPDDGARQPAGAVPADSARQRADSARMDDLAIARQRRSQRLRGWLTAAAVVVVVGTGFGAIQHFTVGSANNTSATSGSGGAMEDQSLPAPAAANSAGADGVLSTSGFAAEAKAFVAAQTRSQSQSPSSTSPTPLAVPRPTASPQTALGSPQCATAAAARAAAIAGSNAAGGNTVNAAAQPVGAVTVDGRKGVLYLVDVGPVKVALALANCSSSNPDVLAGATL